MSNRFKRMKVDFHLKSGPMLLKRSFTPCGFTKVLSEVSHEKAPRKASVIIQSDFLLQIIESILANISRRSYTEMVLHTEC